MRHTAFDILSLILRAFSKPPKVEKPEPEGAQPISSPEEPEFKPITKAELEEAIDRQREAAKPKPEFVWHDLRGEKRTKSRGESKGHRDWSKITGITLHQTAVDFGTNPMRMLNVPAHGATLSDGSIVLLHEPTDYMWHGHSFNRRDIGIEVSCRAAGVEGEGETLWLPKKYKGVKGDERLKHGKEATDEQLEATKELVRHYIALVAENGGEIRYIHAHRQASKSKISDPGSRIWKAVGKWAVEELGLSAGPPGWTSGGTPLPDAWTGEPNGIRYGRKYDGRIIENA